MTKWYTMPPGAARERAKQLACEVTDQPWKKIRADEFATLYMRGDMHAYRGGSGKFHLYRPGDETAKRLAYCLAQTSLSNLPRGMYAVRPESYGYLRLRRRQHESIALLDRGSSLLAAIHDIESQESK